MKSHYELVVIGAGPAGMSAARVAAEGGLSVAVFDEQGATGGQIYRGVGKASAQIRKLLGESYTEGRALVDAFDTVDDVDYFAGASVWNLDVERMVSVLYCGMSYEVQAERVIICVGAQERPMPIVGWELPGVMSAGAGQILLKTGTMVPRGGVVLAGSGPLLLLLAWQYLRAEVKIKAILDTTPRGRLWQGGRHLVRSCLSILNVKAGVYLFTGLKLMAGIRWARVRVVRCVEEIQAEGGNDLAVVRFRVRSKWQEVASETLLLHQGVVPQLQLALTAGCDAVWSEQQACWQVDVNEFGESSVAGIFIAGDGGAIVGAHGSQLQGEVCGLRALLGAGKIEREEFGRRYSPLQRLIKGHLSIRPFLDLVYRPVKGFLVPHDATLVCRCEGITAGEIRKVAKLGCQGPNQMKSFTRCGMGPCQGRMCGAIVAAIIADEQGRPVEQVGFYRVRPPVKPITLGEIGL